MGDDENDADVPLPREGCTQLVTPPQSLPSSDTEEAQPLDTEEAQLGSTTMEEDQVDDSSMEDELDYLRALVRRAEWSEELEQLQAIVDRFEFEESDQ